MTKQQNFFINEGETFVTDIAVSDTSGPVNLTGHAFTLVTTEGDYVGTIAGSTVTFTVSGLVEDTKYQILHTYPDATVEWVLYGVIYVKVWVE